VKKNKVYGRKSECVTFFNTLILFTEIFLQCDWLSTIYSLPRGQSHLAKWQQLLTVWEAEFFHCRHVRCIDNERHHHSIRYAASEP
jgi:hypothetical protein